MDALGGLIDSHFGRYKKGYDIGTKIGSDISNDNPDITALGGGAGLGLGYLSSQLQTYKDVSDATGIPLKQLKKIPVVGKPVYGAALGATVIGKGIENTLTGNEDDNFRKYRKSIRLYSNLGENEDRKVGTLIGGRLGGNIGALHGKVEGAIAGVGIGLGVDTLTGLHRLEKETGAVSGILDYVPSKYKAKERGLKVIDTLNIGGEGLEQIMIDRENPTKVINSLYTNNKEFIGNTFGKPVKEKFAKAGESLVGGGLNTIKGIWG